MTSLAKLHGVSYVLIKENGGKAAYLEKYPYLSDINLMPEVEALNIEFMNPTLEALFGMLKVISRSHYFFIVLYIHSNIPIQSLHVVEIVRSSH